MDLRHEFTVPASVDETWAALNDIESVAGCFPGATVTSVEGDSFKGSCKVKLGPIALVYNGSGTFVEKDETAHTMRIEAKGKDKRGNGTAGADVTATMAETDGGTQVTVTTDLAITGKPAQFGRGVIEDVSDKLLGQFVECLQGKVGAPEDAESSPTPAEDAEPSPTPAGDAESAPTPGPDGANGGSSPAPAAAGTHRAAEPGGTAASTDGAASSAGGDDALDLGATVVPILLRTYGKQLAAGLGVLVVLVWLLRRRKG